MRNWDRLGLGIGLALVHVLVLGRRSSSNRNHVVAVLLGALVLGGCADFQFADELRCSGLGNCPPGYFCDENGGNVCRTDLKTCGNGNLDPGEVCDDGGRESGDGCRSDCLKAEICGDGALDPQEKCDDGNTLGGDGCSATCELEACGNGTLDDGEECDDGSANGETADCLPTCVKARCGDGFLRAGAGAEKGEDCDDGPANGDTAACLSTCVLAKCGDGHVHAGVEECDDANQNDSDGCTSSCHMPTCGDGFVQVGVELCDSNALNGCNADCRTSKVLQVVAGVAHTCILRAGGGVRCWGSGALGQQGRGNTASIGDQQAPALSGDIAIGGAVTQIAAGAFHTCALLDTGAVRCWGAGGSGRLGYGNTANVGDNETPASVGDVAIGGTVTQIAAGGSHTCALLTTGAVRCWGAASDGQLGYGNTTAIGDNEAPATAGDVPVGAAVAQIVAGDRHTCALLVGGAVRCWGSGADGRLGYGNTLTIGDTETPMTTGDVALGVAAVQLAAGERHTCAVLATGAARCWGAGADGRLGYGNTLTIGDDESPTEDIAVCGNVAQIVAGQRHTCALFYDGANVSTRCWGANTVGQLGYGNITTIGDDELPSSITVNVKTGGLAVQIAAGHSHTCALIASGDVACWGEGADGRLGLGSTTTFLEPKPVLAVGAVTQLALGGTHVCALGDAGQVRCWGFGGNGALGYGNTNDIGDNEFPFIAGDVDVGGFVIQIAAGTAHTCALLATGKVRCWGSGGSGALGYGTTNTIGDNESPATAGDVAVGGPVIQIVAGSSHTCALLATGTVRCWGLASSGVLGYGNSNTIGDNETPATAGDVDVGGTVVQLAAGTSHTCALLATGKVRCWGFGDNGRLGYGNTNSIGANEAPATAGDVDVGGPVVQIAAGDRHTCALLATGTVRCWGSASFGQLGYGNSTQIGDGDGETPATAGDVPINGTVTQIALGSEHSCGLLTDDTLRCWGNGFGGALGYQSENTIGDDERGDAAGPVQVGGRVLQVDLGSSFTCARLASGHALCWGSNSDGKLGQSHENPIGINELPQAAGHVSVF